MPAAASRQRSGSRSSSKRPESPIKRTPSARLTRSARSPSPFSPNTSHNEMSTPAVLKPDSDVILKPAQPIRRRSTRLSTATAKASASDSEEKASTAPMTRSSSSNGHAIKLSGSIYELDESPAKASTVVRPAVANGHAANDAIPMPNGSTDYTKSPFIAETATTEARVSEQLTQAAPLQQTKPKIDWEIPRKALHSSIGVVVVALYALSFTIPPIVAVLTLVLFGISLLDFVRLNNPSFERMYERVCGPLMRESEKHKINGTVWYLIGVIFVLTFYPADIAVTSILILSWADTAASTIGRLWGRYTPKLPARIPYLGLRIAPQKSTAGYAAAWVTGGLITAAFIGSHASQSTGSDAASALPWPSFAELSTLSWKEMWTIAKSYTNIGHISVNDIPGSWSWAQRVGGGWPGLVVMGLWAGFVTALSEALDLGEMDDNLTLPIMSGLGIWLYVALLRWIDQHML